MSELFNFTSYINPPTKNEEKYLTLRTGRKIKNKKYYEPWEAIHNEMFLKRFGVTKAHFENLPKSEIIKLQKELTKKNVIVSFWNGFHRMDLENFKNELNDRLEGIAYVNDRQIKQSMNFKDDSCDREYFKVVVELME
jgi:hypothetical protein